VDELHTSLNRLAPSIDAASVDAALGTVRERVRRSRRRRRTLTGAATAAVLLVAASGLAHAGQTRDAAQVVSGAGPVAGSGTTPGSAPSGVGAEPIGTEPSASTTDEGTAPAPPLGESPTSGASTTTEPTPAGATTSEPPSSGPGAAGAGSATTKVPVSNPLTSVPTTEPAPQITMRVTAAEQSVVIGGRIHLSVQITNHGPTPMLIDAGGCGITELVQIEGLPGWEFTGRLRSPMPVELWDAKPGTLGSFLANNDEIRAHWYVMTPNSGTACPAYIGYRHLAPGASTTLTDLFDTAVVPGPTTTPAQLTVSDSITVRGDFDSATPTIVSDHVDVAISDDPRVHAEPSRFIAAVEANPIVTSWLDAHQAVSGTTGDRVALGFVAGELELWIDNGTSRLRIRGDATAGTITDIRTLSGALAPSDDPDLPHDPTEQILYPAS
jgi:hypothetical protein